MNTNMQGHNHGWKSHLLGMLGIGALVLVVLLGTGRSFQQALPLALALACPLMMVGMMFMMRGGNGQQHGNDAPDQRDHNDATDRGNPKAPETWQDSPNITPLGPQRPPRCPNRVIPKGRPVSPASPVLLLRLAAGGDYLDGPGSAPLTSAFLLQQPVGQGGPGRQDLQQTFIEIPHEPS